MWDMEWTKGVVRIMKNKIFMILCLKCGGYWLPFLNAGMSEQTVDGGARYNGSTICSQVCVCCFLPGKVNILTMKCLLSINNMSQYYTHLMPHFSFVTLLTIFIKQTLYVQFKFFIPDLYKLTCIRPVFFGKIAYKF